MLLHTGLFVFGLALLAVGGGFLALAVAALARRYGASAFVAALVAVALGTTAAAMAFDLSAIARGRMRLAVGNIVGVGVTHVGLVLGLAALVRPLAGASRVVSAAIPVAIGGTWLFWFTTRNNEVATPAAAVLVLAFIAAVTYLSGVAKQEPPAVREEFDFRAAGPSWVAWVLAVFGVLALAGGGALAATEAGEMMRTRLLSAVALGATAAALGTSLPGLVVALVASHRDRPDVALGAVMGACLCNALLVPGVAGLAAAAFTEEAGLLVDPGAVMNQIPAMAILSLLLLTVYFNRLEVSRWQGGIFLATYAAFIAWQVV